MARRHKVTIMESGGVCRVEPARVYAFQGDEVVFLNKTHSRVAIFFPEGDLFKGVSAPCVKPLAPPAIGKKVRSAGPFTVDGSQFWARATRGRARQRARGKALGKRHNQYAYAVFCHTPGDFAVGNSNPIIIIDR